MRAATAGEAGKMHHPSARLATRGSAGRSASVAAAVCVAFGVLFSYPLLSQEKSAAPPEPYQEECFQCHSAKENLEPVTPGLAADKLVVPAGALAGSVHEELSCSDCHASAGEDAKAHYEGGPRLKLACGECHDKALEKYNGGDIHGRQHEAGNKLAPWCNDCHGSHSIVPLGDERSPLSDVNEPETCGKCHGGQFVEEQPGISKRRLVERYYSGVHWEKIKEGRPAAECHDCHGTHDILPSSETGSEVGAVTLLNTCAKCHSSVVQAFSHGSHGRALLAGNQDVPTCTTCHGDHDMVALKVQTGGKRDFAATQICMWCHGNARMMARYALDTTPVDSYLKDFHGLTQRGSFGASATCADCHEAHRSLPSSHPESRMHVSNRGAACGKCHGQSSESFIMSFTHKTAMTEGTRGQVKRIIAIIYIGLIAVTIGGMFLHNLIIWLYYVRLKLRYQKRRGKVVRLNKFERFWHWLLFITFGLLAFTGFALSFSESGMFKWLYQVGLTEVVRGWIHRLNAVLLLANMFLFLLYNIVSRRGRIWIRDMLPRMRDFRDLFSTLRFYMGFAKEKPKFAIFNYGEKAEYWALWWGIAVMALTGFMLWFSKLLPTEYPWLIDAARAIHFYEAVLACLAILVWHFFHTIYHPAEYPMDTAWLSGSLSDHEAHERFEQDAVDAMTPTEPTEPPPDHPKPKEWL